MKKITTLAAIVAMTAMALSSCSGSGSDKDSLFGSLPGEYAEMMAEEAKLKEKATKITTEAEKAKFIEESQKLNEKWSAKLEKSAQKLDGKEINLSSDGQFKVTSPVSLTLDKIGSKDLSMQFKVTGGAEAAEPITIANAYTTSRAVFIAGYDENGTELFKSPIGQVTGTANGADLEIPAGTPVQFSTLSFNKKYVEEYPLVKTLKLTM